MEESSKGQMIVKANRLVQAKMPLTKVEHRIIGMLISQIDKDDEEFGFQKIYVKDLKETANISSKSLYQRAEELCSSLLEKKIEIKRMEDGKRVYHGISLMRSCKYEEGDGYIRARFNEDMKEYLLQLKRRFTMYEAGHFLPLRSTHSMRIYELLKMREDVDNLYMDIEELRDILGLQDSYEYFSHLEKHVIQKAQDEIAEKTDIHFTYDVRREGRSAKEIEFFIHSDKDLSEGPQKVEDRTSTPSIDVVGMFKSDLTQEELDSLDEEETQSLHERALEQAQRENLGGGSTMLQAETYRLMKQLWASQ